MLSNFERYSKEMKTFEQSTLFEKKYNQLILFLHSFTKNNPITSTQIEKQLSLRETQVRDLVKHARRNGEPIASGNRGYYIELNYDILMHDVDHIKERAESELFTYYQMKKNCQCKPQMDLLARIPKNAYIVCNQ